MSKSKGNIVYSDMLRSEGYSFAEIRFCLIYGHYRRTLSFSRDAMRSAADRLQALRGLVRPLVRRAGNAEPRKSAYAGRVAAAFRAGMDNDLNVGQAVDDVCALLSVSDPARLSADEAAAVLAELRAMDAVLRVIFDSRGKIKR
jgi:cysteinyl-tRNA synthetase